MGLRRSKSWDLALLVVRRIWIRLMVGTPLLGTGPRLMARFPDRPEWLAGREVELSGFS